MTSPDGLRWADDAPTERSDAARNRVALLAAARELVVRDGVAGVTTDAVAERACVGKGTVFRRFGSRDGLLTALLDESERAWQDAVLRGPAPLGPGAEPLERLEAFARSRLAVSGLHLELLRALGSPGRRSLAAWDFTILHVASLLRALRVHGDLGLLARQVSAPLWILEIDAAREADIDDERYVASWLALIRCLTRG